ncbi:MAG: dTDP-4-dehydrorhamnose reductase [Deltaproteobacteria bacterium CG11_big_fil_rev_8_21_14_0_20_42_23]|nr:MAG: dTDP-4-dehydrorhamnose reductase [Deltaproteobacteria bacterium CG11_big_fil_rev_8_21_14_0_20_42_23]PJC64886.1 MAG: dTDP-4-dehydrorhamnose reductase [Deltaproteobacteria bacterium CG_4_9_14_0_2_um_filter_42_21]
MKWMVFGCNGTLGSELVALLKHKKEELFAFSHQDVSIEDENLISKKIHSIQPDVIINAAAYNAVDAAEQDQEKAFSVNSKAVLNLALQASDCDAIFVHYSTDYVFDGAKKTAYSEDDFPFPLSVYGKTKLSGEQSALAGNKKTYALRPAVVFGSGGNNFLSRLLHMAKEKNHFNMVTNLIGSPTPAYSLAEASIKLVESSAPFGLYHAAGEDFCSRYEFAQAINQLWELGLSITPVVAEEKEGCAKRPHKVILENKKLSQLGIHIDSWQKGLEHIRKHQH